MPSVTVHREPGDTATPSQEILADANRVVYETDVRGRRIGVKRITALQLFRLTKLLGEASGVAATLNLAMSACSVCEIAGDAVPFPASERELEVLMQRLDFDGLNAATEATRQFGAGKDDEAAAAKN